MRNHIMAIRFRFLDFFKFLLAYLIIFLIIYYTLDKFKEKKVLVSIKYGNTKIFIKDDICRVYKGNIFDKKSCDFQIKLED